MGNPTIEALVAGDGEIAALMRSQLASEGNGTSPVTPLGPIESWSSSLKTSFSLLFNSCCPMFLVWDCDASQKGAGERVLFYNDAYSSLQTTAQHSIALGQSLSGGWPAGWSHVQLDVEQVLMTGRAVRRERQPWGTRQNESRDQPLYTWAYSAVWDETGHVRGVVATGCLVLTETATVAQACRPTPSDHRSPEPHPSIDLASLEQAKAALKESEARFQAFMSHSPTSAWIADQAGRVLYLSPTYSQMFQCLQQAEVGKQVYDIYSEEFAEQFLENNRRVFESGQVVETIETAPRPDGTIGSFLVYKFPILQASGEMLLGGVAIDITDHKQTEAALRQREEELRLITNALPVLVAYVDKHHYYRFNNQTYETWFGQPATSFTGKHVREVLGEAAYAALYPYMEQAFSGQRVSFESQIPYREGGIRYIKADYVPHRNPAGEVEGYFSLVSDITERQQAEVERERLLQELASERARFEAVLRQMPEGVIIADAVSGKIMLANERINQILQHSFELNVGLEEYDQQLSFQAYHPDGQVYAPEEYPLVRSLRTGEVVSHEEMEIHYPDGCWIVVDTNSSPIFDSQGQITSAVVLIQEITQRKRAELALRRSEERARLAIQVGRLGLWRYNLATGLIELDERMREIWGESHEVETLSLPEVMERIHPDDRERVTDALNAALAPDSPGTYAIDYRILWDDGTERWVSANGQVLFVGSGPARQPISFLGTALDISDRKQSEAALRHSEEKFRKLANAMPQIVWIADADGNVDYLSQQWFDYAGLTLEQTQDSAQYLQVIHPDDVSQHYERWVEAVASGSLYQAEIRIKRASDGAYRWFLTRAIPVKTEQGQIVAWYGTSTDIDDHKRTAAALSRSEERLRLAMDGAQMGTWDVNLVTGEAIWSERHFTMLGYEPVASGKASEAMWSHCIHPDDLERVSQEWQHSRQERRPYQAEYRVIRADDGRIAWLAALGTFTYDTRGEAIRSIGVLFDISERKRAEAELRNSEQRLQLAQQAGRIGTWDWNLVTHEVSWSDGIWTILALEPNSVTPGLEMFTQFIHPEDRAQAFERVEAVLAQGDDYYDEFRIIRQDGVVCWLLSKGRVLRTPDGQPERLLGINIDISDRKQSEAALRHSEERLRLAQQAAGAGLWDWDIRANQVTWSEEYYRLYGVDPAVTPSYDNWLASILEPDRAHADQAARQALEQRTNLNVEFRLLHPVRGLRWLTAIGQTFYDAAGQPLRMTGIALDITDRKQAEAEREQLLARQQAANETLQRFIEHTPVAVVMLDRDMRYLFASQCWLREYAPGYTDLKGVSHYEVMSDIPERWVQVHQRCLAGATERCEADYYPRADGSALWLHWEVLPWYASDDEIGGIIIFAENITERKQAAQERDRLLAREQRAREEAEQANRIKDEFLAVLSHELRSPLNPILGWAKLLQTRQFDAAGTKRALETIERNAKLQTQLIDDLLDVSRILRGKMALEVGAVHLATVIDAALETVRLSAEAKGIDVQKVVADDISLISGDAARLQQVVWNLLTNAVKFTPPGGTIEIRLEQSSTHVQIQVQDTGKGINPEFLPHVFEYFRQEDGTTTRKFGGLGLGLAIVRYLTEQHGGMVKADSPGEGLGATFTVLLPLANAGSGQPRPEVVSLNPVAQPLPLAGLRILVVDDDADMRDLMLTILEQAGAQVEVASSAVAALDRFHRYQPDLLLSDIGMPEMDGYQLLRQIRQRSPEQNGDVPAIALTAYAGEVNQKQALAAGFQRHVAKPVEPEELIKAITTLVKPC